MLKRILALAVSSAVLATVAGATLASAATPVRLLTGTTPETAPFPNDAFTVADAAQLTGKRIALPTAGCDALGRSLCDDLALLNQLDGFDLQPRVTLPFDGPVDLRSVTPTTVYVEAPGGARTGLVQLVFDPGSRTVSGNTDAFLQPRTTYALVITDGVKGADGTPVDLGAGATSRRVPFTTMTSTNTLDKAREQLDAGTAYTDAGITAAQRGIAFDAFPGMARSVFAGPTVVNVERQDQTSADPAAPKTTQNAIVAAKSAAFLGFGSIRSPQYVDGEGVIAQVPSTSAPRPRAAAQIGVTMMTGLPSAISCLQPVVFGPGFSRSKFDLFLSGDLLPGRGTAVFATDPLGHNYGPTSTFSVQTPTGTTTGGKAFGRGKDLDGDGSIGNTEGVGPTYTVSRTATGGFTPSEPSPRTAIGLRDGLIQTVIDNMTLIRALEKGVDVNGDGTVDTCVGPGHEVSYYGQSFGGIYGTMLLGTDPHVTVGVPNVPGGPIIDIARTSGFRANIAAVLQANKPNLLNGGPGRNGFTESLPLRLDPRIDKPFAGSKPIRDLFGRGNWVARPGSPETYASRLGKGGLFADKKVIFQIAYTDGTVPNPASGTLLRAGDLYDKAWVYRNDRTPTVQTNPHGFLLDPTLTGRNQGQQQIQDWITSKGATETDPDAAGSVWEKNPELYRVQLDCLHYPDPQAGPAQTRTANSPDCTDQSASVAAGPAPGVAAPPAAPAASG
ncbi:MAG: hypothetical protein JWN57_1512, partial [Frankiales bacterium]|nr:hypothetical protein [Frankiales bacterium]